MSTFTVTASLGRHYRIGPIYQTALIVSGGMCTGLNIAILIGLARHQIDVSRLQNASVLASPATSTAFVICGLALIGIGAWFPKVTSVLATVLMALSLSFAAEWVFGAEPKLEQLISANLYAGRASGVAPNTIAVFLFGACALMLRQKPRWFGGRLWAIAVLGSLIFAIGIVGCMGYMAGVPTYVWDSRAPMSCSSAICASILGMGIIMSAFRYSELDDSGMPKWFPLVLCTGALAIHLSTIVSFVCGSGHSWGAVSFIRLSPMIVVSSVLLATSARRLRLAQNALTAGWQQWP